VPERSRASGRCFIPSIEHFIHQTLRPDVFHVHLEWRFVWDGDGHNMSLLVELTLDAIVHEGNETRSYDDTESG
jgi:hypothetical protein